MVELNGPLRRAEVRLRVGPGGPRLRGGSPHVLRDRGHRWGSLQDGREAVDAETVGRRPPATQHRPAQRETEGLVAWRLRSGHLRATEGDPAGRFDRTGSASRFVAEDGLSWEWDA